MAVQEKTSDSFPPYRIGYLGNWVDQQRSRKRGAKGFAALSKEEEDKVRSMHQALSQ